MKIRNVVHRGLRRFIERNDASGLPASAVERIRNMVTFLLEMSDLRELRGVPAWKAHPLTAAREYGA